MGLRPKSSQLLKIALDWKKNHGMESVENGLYRFGRGGFEGESAETPHFSPDAEVHPLFGSREFLFSKLIGGDQPNNIIARREAGEFEAPAAIQSLLVRRCAGVDLFRVQLVEDFAFAIYLQLHGQLRLAGLWV